MNRSDFAVHVSETLTELLHKSELRVGRPLPCRLAFRWLGKGHTIITENIVTAIVDRVYQDEEHIFSCVDLAVADLIEAETLLIVAHVSGYPPRPFGLNWTGRAGPFVLLVGQPLLNRFAGQISKWSPEDGAFGYVNLDFPSKP